MAVWKDELLGFPTPKDSGISLNDFLMIESSSESNWCLRMKTLWFQITDRFANSMIRFLIRFLPEQVASDWIFHFTPLLFEMNSKHLSKCNNRRIFCQDFTLYHHSYPWCCIIGFYFKFQFEQMPDAPRPSELPVLAAAGHHDAHEAHFSAVASLVTAAENRHKYDCLTFSLSLHKRLQDNILLPTCEAVQLV